MSEMSAAQRPPRRRRLLSWPAGFRPSLRFGLLALSVVAMLPVGGMLAVGLSVAWRNTEEHWQSQTLSTIERLSDSVRHELDPIRDNAAYMAAMAATGRLDPSDHAGLVQQLMAGLAGMPHVSDLALIDTDINVTVVNRARQRVTRANWADDPQSVENVREGAQAKSSYWSGFFFAESARSTRLELRTPISRDGRYLGLLISVVTTSGLSELVSRTGREIGGEAFVLAGREAVVAHPRLTKPIGGINDAHPLPDLHEVEDPVLAAIWRPRDLSPGRFRLLQTAHSHVGRIDGVDHLYLYRLLDGYGREPWLIGLHRPLEGMQAPFRRIWLLMAAGIGATLLTAALCWLVGQRITRPLEQLAVRARCLTAFDWSGGPVQPSLFREINEAGRALNSLAEGLVLAATYLPNNLVRRLIGKGQSGQALTATRDVTVMFTDIVGFSTNAAGLSPAATVALLNAHFAVLVPCVEGNAGTVDKFIGDGLMAFWGAPDAQADHAERALCAALDMQAAMESENNARHARGEAPIRMRIGMHSGPALVGNIGAPGRIDYTLIGDTVNIAQRMEDYARNFMAEKDVVTILLSGDTLQRIGPGLESFSLGTHLVPGHGGEVEVFRLA